MEISDARPAVSLAKHKAPEGAGGFCMLKFLLPAEAEG